MTPSVEATLAAVEEFNSPAELIPSLRRVFPSSRATADGIAFDLADPDACPAAIRERVSLQRLAPQSHVASP